MMMQDLHVGVLGVDKSLYDVVGKVVVKRLRQERRRRAGFNLETDQRRLRRVELGLKLGLHSRDGFLWFLFTLYGVLLLEV